MTRMATRRGLGVQRHGKYDWDGASEQLERGKPVRVLQKGGGAWGRARRASEASVRKGARSVQGSQDPVTLSLSSLAAAWKSIRKPRVCPRPLLAKQAPPCLNKPKPAVGPWLFAVL